MATRPALPARRATARLRIRGDAPMVSSPLVGYLEVGEVFEPVATVVGDSVRGNAAWYELAGKRFVWSGVSEEIRPASTPPVPSPITVNRRSNGTIKQLSVPSIKSVFGDFDYTDTKPRGAIAIESGWSAANITTIDVPFLARTGFGSLYVHSKAAEPFTRVFEKIESAGLDEVILTCAGTFVPRHMSWNPARDLSSHSWGIAIDLNDRWNPQGAVPVAIGAIGSVRELVPIFASEGFAWGGHFEPLKYTDGMHFELARTDL